MSRLRRLSVFAASVILFASQALAQQAVRRVGILGSTEM